MTADTCPSCEAPSPDSDVDPAWRVMVPTACDKGDGCPFLNAKDRALRVARAAIDQAKEKKR